MFRKIDKGLKITSCHIIPILNQNICIIQHTSRLYGSKMHHVACSVRLLIIKEKSVSSSKPLDLMFSCAIFKYVMIMVSHAQHITSDGNKAI